MNTSNATGQAGERLAPWRQFDCRADPFRSGFDARFVYRGEAQRRLLARLHEDLGSAQGALVVTGAAGTGKTTLLRCLGEALRQQPGEVVLLGDTGSIPSLEALVGACRRQAGWGDAKDADDPEPKAALRALMRPDEPERIQLLVIDEGQSISDGLLMELFTAMAPVPQGAGPLPIILAGQPAFAERLARPPLREHGGVIRREYELGPLASTEVGAFIAHRLRAAGCPEPLPFTGEAIERIARYTAGVPASIIALCQLASFFAVRNAERRIDGRAVDLAASATLLSASGGTPSPLPAVAHAPDPAPAVDQVRPAAVSPDGTIGAGPSGRPGAGAGAAARGLAAPGSAPREASGDIVAGMLPAVAENRRRPPRRRVQLGFWGLAWAPAVVVMAIGAAAFVPVGHDKLEKMSATLDAWLAGVTGGKAIPTKTSAPESPRVAGPVFATDGPAPAWPVQDVDGDDPQRQGPSTAGSAAPVEADRARQSPPPGAVSVGEGPDAPSAEPVGDPARSAALGSQAPRIARLLALAARYVREDRLVSPRFDNALAVYREVLRADPGNRAAIEGLDAIRARLLRHAWAEEARGDLDSARRQLIKIQLIDAGEPVSGGQVRPGPLAANGPEPPVSSTLPASTAEEP